MQCSAVQCSVHSTVYLYHGQSTDALSEDVQVQIPKVNKSVLHTDFIAEKEKKGREGNKGKGRE